MGVASTAQRAARMHSRALDRSMAADDCKSREIHKLLLLGPGEAGKSTLLKQMVSLYGTGLSSEERKAYTPVIHQNVVSAANALITAARVLGTAVEAEAAAQYIRGMDPDACVTLDNVRHFKALWADKGIQRAFANRCRFQLSDAAEYLLDRLDAVADPGYIPSLQDCLRCRAQTTGVVTADFDVDGNRFQVFDVGGQRNERKKWIHCFEDVTAMIFVGVLSEYDLGLCEDPSVNRMVETLTLFEDVVNCEWLANTSVLLFLNKRDLFERKLQSVPLTQCPTFAHYTGPNTFDAGCTLIREAFEARNHHPDRTVYVHVTCATDPNNVAAVFGVVKDIVVRNVLIGEGILV